MYMDVDTALAEVPVNILPLTDDTDFKTIETGLTYNQAGMDLVWNFVTPGGAQTQTAVTPTTGGDYDWTEQGDGMYSIEIPASGGASINNNTEGFGWFSGVMTGVLPFAGPVICFRAAGANDALIESWSATRGAAGTALPAAAADAAGGLVISDAGGLDIDAMNVRVNYGGYDGPRGPGIFINDAAGNTNTVIGTDGTYDNPVSTIAAATTLAGSLGSRRIYLMNDTVITLAATYDAYEFIGLGDLAVNTVALANQDVGGCAFYNVLLSGQQGGSGRCSVFGGGLTSITDFEAYVEGAAIVGNVTVRASADSYFNQCWSAIAGTGTPELTLAANANVNWRHYSGGIQINSMASTNNMSLEGDGQYILDASCTGGTLAVRGAFKKTDNSGLVTIVDDANQYSPIVHNGRAQAGTVNTITLSSSASASDGAYDPSMVQIIAGTGAGQTRLIYGYNGTTKIAVVDRDWKVTPDSTSDYLIIAHPGREHVNEGLAQAGAATTITLNALASASDDAYNGQIVFIRSGTGEDQVRLIMDYNGTTKIATITNAWDINPDATSGYVILPTHLGEVGYSSDDGTDTVFGWLKAMANKAASIPAGIGGTFDPADDSLEAIRDRGDSAWVTGGSGSGSFVHTYTLTDTVDSNPVADCLVWVTSDEAGANFLYSGYTDEFGEVVFNFSAAGTYYFWRKKAGVYFDNPDTETVS